MNIRVQTWWRCGQFATLVVIMSTYLRYAFVLLIVSVPYGALAQTNGGLEDRVRTYFADAPVMIEIARCESEMRQFNADGTALMGGAGKKMVGLYQIHTGVHTSMARSLGLDLDTVEGNLAYARYLYENEGTVPWNSSGACWRVAQAELEGGALLPARASTIPSILSIELSFGMDHAQVLELQKLLNRAGFTIAQEGPGSPGNETTYFGAKTLEAVRKFQCERGIICGGGEPYGIVGPKTRTLLNTAHEKSTISSSAVAVPTTTMHTQAQPNTVEAAIEVYTVEQMQEIARLQSQIAELLQELARMKGE